MTSKFDKCTKCGKKQKGICKKTGFKYDWCNTCWFIGRDEWLGYLQDVSYGDSFDSSSDVKVGFEAMGYEKEMKDAKNKFLAARSAATMKKCPVRK